MDPSEFGVALINLVVNARHAIEVHGLIEIRTHSAAGKDLTLPTRMHKQMFVCVSVVDNGKGMPEEVRRRAVEPFFTTKGEEGTGFGLSQTYTMMQQLGGDLTIESRVGVGTSITLCFPVAQ
jgi:signal transduction histidine kinase